MVSNAAEDSLVEDYQMVDKTNTLSMNQHSVSGLVPIITQTSSEHPTLSTWMVTDKE